MISKGKLLLVYTIIGGALPTCTLVLGGVRDPWILTATAIINAAIAAKALLQDAPRTKTYTNEKREEVVKETKDQ